MSGSMKLLKKNRMNVGKVSFCRQLRSGRRSLQHELQNKVWFYLFFRALEVLFQLSSCEGKLSFLDGLIRISAAQIPQLQEHSMFDAESSTLQLTTGERRCWTGDRPEEVMVGFRRTRNKSDNISTMGGEVEAVKETKDWITDGAHASSGSL